METVLVIIWSFYWYQSALFLAYIAAGLISRMPGTDLIWRVTYWLVIVIAINIHVMIVHSHGENNKTATTATQLSADADVHAAVGLGEAEGVAGPDPRSAHRYR